MASFEALPTTVNLLKMKEVDNPSCPICIDSPKTVEHALRSCVSTQNTWENALYRRILKIKLKRALLETCFTVSLTLSLLGSGEN